MRTDTTRTMILQFIGALVAIFLILSGLYHASDSREQMQPIETIRFAITNYKECSFALKSDVSPRDLHDAITRSCDIRFQFDIQLWFTDRMNVLSQKDTRRMQKKSILKYASIASMVNALRGPSGHDFRKPLRTCPYKPSDEDIKTFGSLEQTFGVTTNVQQLEWY